MSNGAHDRRKSGWIFFLIDFVLDTPGWMSYGLAPCFLARTPAGQCFLAEVCAGASSFFCWLSRLSLPRAWHFPGGWFWAWMELLTAT
jgi:hypothetical protein